MLIMSFFNLLFLNVRPFTLRRSFSQGMVEILPEIWCVRGAVTVCMEVCLSSFVAV